MKSKKLRIIFSLTLVLVFLISIILFLSLRVPCPILHLTGFYCPSCGISRMLFALFHGDFYQAFRYNALLFCLLPFLLFLWLDVLIKWIWKKPNYLIKRIPHGIWYAFLVVFILFGIARNITIFDFLKPTLIGFL